MIPKHEKGTFEENFLNACENGFLKKGFRLVMGNITVECVRGRRTLSYSFTSNFVQVSSKIYVFKEIGTLEKEVLSLYSQVQNMLTLSKTNGSLAETKKVSYTSSGITLLYYGKIIYSEHLPIHYTFELLNKKLIQYVEINVNNEKYISPNSLDISSLNENAFNSMGRLEKDYKLSIEHGMETKNGVSIFSSFTLNYNDKSCFYVAKLVNTLERILRYQKNIYGEQKNSLVYIKIALFYQDKLIFNKKFLSFNSNLSKKTPMTFNMIFDKVRRNCDSDSMYFSSQ